MEEESFMLCRRGDDNNASNAQRYCSIVRCRRSESTAQKHRALAQMQAIRGDESNA